MTTLAAARKRARHQIGFGFYRPAAPDVPYICCPDCRQRVTNTTPDHVHAYTDARTVCRALVESLAQHLREGCDRDRV